jgi:hypothetical protein
MDKCDGCRGCCSEDDNEQDCSCKESELEKVIILEDDGYTD